jgi:putative hydrolase of the HAD superfamily
VAPEALGQAEDRSHIHHHTDDLTGFLAKIL